MYIHGPFDLPPFVAKKLVLAFHRSTGKSSAGISLCSIIQFHVLMFRHTWFTWTVGRTWPSTISPFETALISRIHRHLTLSWFHLAHEKRSMALEPHSLSFLSTLLGPATILWTWPISSTTSCWGILCCIATIFCFHFCPGMLGIPKFLLPENPFLMLGFQAFCYQKVIFWH